MTKKFMLAVLIGILGNSVFALNTKVIQFIGNELVSDYEVTPVNPELTCKGAYDLIVDRMTEAGNSVYHISTVPKIIHNAINAAIDQDEWPCEKGLKYMIIFGNTSGRSIICVVLEYTSKDTYTFYTAEFVE